MEAAFGIQLALATDTGSFFHARYFRICIISILV